MALPYHTAGRRHFPLASLLFVVHWALARGSPTVEPDRSSPAERIATIPTTSTGSPHPALGPLLQSPSVALASLAPALLGGAPQVVRALAGGLAEDAHLASHRLVLNLADAVAALHVARFLLQRREERFIGTQRSLASRLRERE